MKKIKITVSILALVTVMALNFTHAHNGYGVSLQKVLGSGSSGGSGGSGGTSGGTSGTDSGNSSADCCSSWGSFWGSCVQRKESTKIDVDCKTITTTYYDINGNVVGTSIVSGGTIKASFSGSYHSSSSSESGYKMYNVTKVNCPTDGKCNDCVEYTPKCS